MAKQKKAAAVVEEREVKVGVLIGKIKAQLDNSPDEDLRELLQCLIYIFEHLDSTRLQFVNLRLDRFNGGGDPCCGAC